MLCVELEPKAETVLWFKYLLWLVSASRIILGGLMYMPVDARMNA